MKEEELGLHDRSTVQQIKNFVEGYLERHEPPVKEFNAKEIVRRFQSDLPVFELLQEMIGEGPSAEQYESGVLHTHTQ